MLAKTMISPALPSPDAQPGGRLITSNGRTLPLRETTLTADAGGGIARVVLTQRFVNPHAEVLSVEYLLPLPSDAAISGFSFVLGEQRIVGEIEGRDRARARFEQALLDGHGAALLEQQRSSVFTQKLGNIPPGATLIAEVVVDQPLRWLDEGAWEWRFPTVVGPRYHGAPGRVADAEALLVNVAAPESGGTQARASASLCIRDMLTRAPCSSSHALEFEASGEHTQVQIGGREGVALDRDVVVRWPVAGLQVGVSVLAATPGEAQASALRGDAFALLTLVPPQPDAEMAAIARDLIFLIDTSGSMRGAPLAQAKRLLAAMIDSLGDGDRLEMIEFGDSPRRFSAEPIATTREGKQAARRWLAALEASGGTEMHRAVLEALQPLRPDAQRQVVLVTDGQIGFEQEIVHALHTRLPPGVRLHAVGVGAPINRSLTAAAARAGRGSELCVDLHEDIEQVVPRLLARTSAPLVTELTIEGECLIDTAPRALPDLYAGAPALIAVRMRGPGRLRVHGRCSVGTFEHTVDVPTLAIGEGPASVIALYGREAVEDLECARVASLWNVAEQFDRNIEALGLAFRIATRLTSWIAVTHTRVVDGDALRRHVEQPHELAHGASAEGLGLRTPMADLTSFTGAFPHDDFGGYGSRMRMAPASVERKRSSGVFLLLMLIVSLLIGALLWRCSAGEAHPTVDPKEQREGE